MHSNCRFLPDHIVCKITQRNNIRRANTCGPALKLLNEEMLLATHSHDPCYWGESDVPACGPPASFTVHLVSSAVTPAGSVYKSRGDNGDGCVLASTLCKYDLRNRDLFVLSWARVRRVRRRSLSSELLVCGGGVRSILLLSIVVRCLETKYVCIWRMFVFMSGVVTVWGSVGMFVVYRPLLKIVFF